MTQTNELTLRQLRGIARECNIPHYYRLTKDQLKAALTEQERSKPIATFGGMYKRLNPSFKEILAAPEDR